jgi:hypothetical protein
MKTCDGEAMTSQLICTRIPFPKDVREKNLHIQQEAIQPPIPDVPKWIIKSAAKLAEILRGSQFVGSHF